MFPEVFITLVSPGVMAVQTHLVSSRLIRLTIQATVKTEGIPERERERERRLVNKTKLLNDDKNVLVLIITWKMFC